MSCDELHRVNVKAFWAATLPDAPHQPPNRPSLSQEAISAYCTYFPCNRVLAGMQVPPEVCASQWLLMLLRLMRSSSVRHGLTCHASAASRR